MTFLYNSFGGSSPKKNRSPNWNKGNQCRHGETNVYKECKKRVGSRAEVWHGNALMTSGRLRSPNLMKNKYGRIVSQKKHAEGIKHMARMLKHPEHGPKFKANKYQKNTSPLGKLQKLKKTKSASFGGRTRSPMRYYGGTLEEQNTATPTPPIHPSLSQFYSDGHDRDERSMQMWQREEEQQRAREQQPTQDEVVLYQFKHRPIVYTINNSYPWKNMDTATSAWLSKQIHHGAHRGHFPEDGPYAGWRFTYTEHDQRLHAPYGRPDPNHELVSIRVN